MAAHQMHLRGPWEVSKWTDQTSSTEPPQRIKFPLSCETLLEETRLTTHEEVRLSRRFGKPTNLSPTTRVFLLFLDFALNAELLVNGESLATLTTQPEQRIDITTLLNPRNELVLKTTVPVSIQLTWKTVAIEIQEPTG